MSAFHIIRAIEDEAHKPGEGALSYELAIRLRSGKIIRCAPYKADSYMLKVNETIVDGDGQPGERITYIPYEAIDQVTPIWL